MARSEQVGGHGGGIQPRVTDPQHNVDGLVGLNGIASGESCLRTLRTLVWAGGNLQRSRHHERTATLTIWPFFYLPTVTVVHLLGH